MRPGSGTGVKICGLSGRRDALHARDAGASYLGVVLVPESPRGITPEAARAVVEEALIPVVAVLVNPSVAEASRAAGVAGASVIQLHGEESPETVARIRVAGPWKVWKALRVRNAGDVESGLRRYEEVVDGILLDGWHPERRGGTGISFSWREVEEIRSRFPREVLFVAAGGLKPGNVGEAVRRLRPDVVDVSSGVEIRPGVKDPEAVEAFIRNATRGERERKGEGR
jgi:phosphoribosylanthranilate isomerase